MDKNKIRCRDRYYYGVIPEGMQMHHLWYSEEYDPASFVIISKEEHMAIHGRSTGRVSEAHDFKKSSKEYYENNREYKLEYQKKYSEEHSEERKEYNRKYREEHKEQCEEREREWRKNNEEAYREYHKKYREEHREEIRKKNRERYLIRKHREKLIKLGVI